MAFFKFRKGGDDHPTPAAAPQSVEAMRPRARHRLIGASVLVLLGVIGFPLLFDSQPRPIAVDIPIEIPDKNAVTPLTTTVPAKPASDVVVESDAGKPVTAPAAVASAPSPAPSPVVAPSRASTGSMSVPSAPAKPVPKVQASKPAEKPAPKPVDKPADKLVEKPTPRVDDGAKARALLEGREADKPAATTGRFVVQIGAFADAVKAQEARVKLEKAGLKTYTQVVQPKEGKRIRVRVGPFQTKAEADKAAEKIRKLDLPAGILEL